MMKQIELEIMSETVRLDDVKFFLENQPQWAETQIVLELKEPARKYRSNIDPTVLVAIITVGGMALTTLIKGLLEKAQQKNSEGITMIAKDITLKIPANTPDDKIETYLNMLEKSNREQSDIERILLG